MKGSKKLVVLYTRINGVERVQVEPEFAAKDKRERSGRASFGYEENRKLHKALGLKAGGAR